MNKFFRVLIAVLLGLLLGLEIAVLIFIPEWSQPEGIAAGAIWGGVVLVALMISLPAGLIAGGITFFLGRRNANRMIIVESGLLIAAALIIFILIY